MDSSVGFEVGAEVELNDCILAVEDCPTIKVENKQDLPQWHHLCYSEDSSSDESIDYQNVLFTPHEARNLEMLNYGSEIESLIEEKEQLESKISKLSGSEELQMGLEVRDIQRDEKTVVWGSICSNDHQDHTFQMNPGFDETEISHTEVIMGSGYDQSPSSAKDLNSVSFLSPEENKKEDLGKYSYYNAKTQFAGTVKPWGRSHKCPRCGRQFGRMYNLEKHICIKTALVFPPPSLCAIFGNGRKETNASTKNSEQNLESMDSLENMCFEAQKQLQSLQGQYGNEEYAPLPIITMEENFSYMQKWSQDGLPGEEHFLPANKMSDKGTITCQRCGHWFRSRCNLEFHTCCSEGTNSIVSQNGTPQNDSAFDQTNSIPTPLFVQGEQALDSHTRHLPSPSGKLKMDFTNSDQTGDCKENIIQSKKVPGKATEILKCQQCKRVYSKRCSYVTHIRWHMKERDFAALVTGTAGKTTSVADGQEPECAPQHANVSKEDPANSQKLLGQTFTCQHCGTVFNKHCSYATHTRWHLKEALSNVTAKPAREGLKTASPSKKVTAVATKQLDRFEKITRPIFICQQCGRVFNRLCSYNTHVRWHKKEKEFERSVEAQQVLLEEGDLLGQQNKSTEEDCGEVMTFSDIRADSSHCQDYYHGQVRHRNLGKQYNLHTNEETVNSSEDAGNNPLLKQVESNHQKPLTVVPEYIFELVVGSEEALVSEGQNVNQDDLKTAEDVEEVMPIYSNESLTSIAPPNEKPFYLPLVLPWSLVNRVTKRQKPPHQCRDCGARFYQPWWLKWHQHKQVARNRWKKHQCDCGRSPVGSLHYLRHQLQHLKDTAFICAVCGKSLRGYRQLQAHSWLHPLVSQFQCKCGARFTRLSKYLWHSLLNKTKHRKFPKQTKPLGVQAAPQENM